MLESLIIHDAATAHLFHTAMEWLALSGGFLLYRKLKSRSGKAESAWSRGSMMVLIGCLLGAGIGNKLVALLQYPQVWPLLWNGQTGSFWLTVFSGQSVVGGLLGGWIGVEVGKKFSGIRSRTGDDFVVPILAGLMIGRTGCFIAGLHDGTYGIHTDWPWAVDFGDGPRHPTQLYEWLAAAVALTAWPWWRRFFAHEAGLAFRVMMSGYLVWRLLIDGLKPVPPGWPLGLSGIQWVCLLGLAVMGLSYRKARPLPPTAPAQSGESSR